MFKKQINALILLSLIIFLTNTKLLAQTADTIYIYETIFITDTIYLEKEQLDITEPFPSITNNDEDYLIIDNDVTEPHLIFFSDDKSATIQKNNIYTYSKHKKNN